VGPQQLLHEHIRSDLVSISIKTRELLQNKSLTYNWITYSDYLWPFKKLNGVSLKIKGVGPQQWVLEHIRSGLVSLSVKTRELLQNKSLTYDWTLCTDYLGPFKKIEKVFLDNKGCGTSTTSSGTHQKWFGVDIYKNKRAITK